MKKLFLLAGLMALAITASAVTMPSSQAKVPIPNPADSVGNWPVYIVSPSGTPQPTAVPGGSNVIINGISGTALTLVATPIAITAAQLTTTANVGRRWLSQTAVALSTTDYPLALSSATGTTAVPSTVIVGHTGNCTEMLIAITNAVTTPTAYDYVSSTALPIAYPNNANGSILHLKLPSGTCAGKVNVSAEGQ